AQLDAIDARHHAVENEDGRLRALLNLLPGRVAVLDDRHVRAASRKRVCRQPPADRVVVRNENLHFLSLGDWSEQQGACRAGAENLCDFTAVSAGCTARTCAPCTKPCTGRTPFELA